MRLSLPVPTRRLVAATAGGAVLVLLLPLDPPGSLVAVNLVLLVLAAADWAYAPVPLTVAVERRL